MVAVKSTHSPIFLAFFYWPNCNHSPHLLFCVQKTAVVLFHLAGHSNSGRNSGTIMTGCLLLTASLDALSVVMWRHLDPTAQRSAHVCSCQQSGALDSQTVTIDRRNTVPFVKRYIFTVIQLVIELQYRS